MSSPYERPTNAFDILFDTYKAFMRKHDSSGEHILLFKGNVRRSYTDNGAKCDKSKTVGPSYKGASGNIPGICKTALGISQHRSGYVG